jgi:hypothetical protein
MRKTSSFKEDIAPRIKCSAAWRLLEVRALEGYIIAVTFMDGTQGVIDMKALILGAHAGIFSQLKDIDNFKQVYIEYGVATWPGEIDLAPDAMYDQIKKHGQWVLPQK